MIRSPLILNHNRWCASEKKFSAWARKIWCENPYEATITVFGKKISVVMPECRLYSDRSTEAGWTPVGGRKKNEGLAFREALQIDLGTRLICEFRAKMMLGCRIGSKKWKKIIKPIFWNGKHKPSEFTPVYYIREFARKFPKPVCGICNRTVNSRTKKTSARFPNSWNIVESRYFPEWSCSWKVKGKNLGSKLVPDQVIFVCSVACEQKLQAKREELELCLKKERERLLEEERLLENCRNQLKAIKSFLKDGNLEVFQSLPSGFGPVSNFLD